MTPPSLSAAWRTLSLPFAVATQFAGMGIIRAGALRPHYAIQQTRVRPVYCLSHQGSQDCAGHPTPTAMQAKPQPICLDALQLDHIAPLTLSHTAQACSVLMS